MEVNGKVFYHILTISRYARYWKPGKTITYKEENNFLIYTRLAELTKRIEEVKKDKPYLLENLQIIKKAEKVYNGTDDFDIFEYIYESKQQLGILINRVVELHNVTFGYVNLLNELIFERVRYNDFPELPSRLKCAWLCDKQQVGKWWREFNAREYKKIFKVEAYGKVIRADRSWMPTDISPVKEQFSLATEYWNGNLNPTTKSRLREYLFIGKLKVIEEIEPQQLLKYRV